MQAPSRIIVHLLYRFEFGGMQSLLAECIRSTAQAGMRHVVICLADFDPAAAATLGEVECIALARHTRGAWSAHRTLYALLRRLRPTTLHTYNIGTLEYVVTGALAGVPHRVHAEHGRGMHERRGDHTKYNLLRYLLAPFIGTFVTVSSDMRSWLTDTVGIAPRKVSVIRNGIDITRFHPAPASVPAAAGSTFTIGTIGRLDPIKAQSDLVDAFITLRQRHRDGPVRLRLVIVGEGPLQPALAAQIDAAGISESVWMPGARRDIAEIMRSLNVFVLPSISEASPITLLEAMACGVPVVATHVGGVAELLGTTRGTLVAPSDPAALAAALQRYLDEPSTARRHADVARAFVVDQYNIDATAAAYAALYSPA